MEDTQGRYEDISLAVDDGSAWITICRERYGNSFRLETLREIEDAVTRAAATSSVRALVLTGEGTRFFSTGGDVADYYHRFRGDTLAFRSYQRAIESCLETILHCPRPVITRVNGVVAGGANAFHLAADLVVATTHATFQQVGTRIGSVSGLGPTQWWPLVVGERRARELLLRARPITAEVALEWGALNDVGTQAEIDKAIDNYVEDFRSGFPDAIRYTRMSLNTAKEHALREVSQAREWLTMHFPSMESVEGFSSFLEKRSPDSTASWACADDGGVTVAPWGRAGTRCGSCGAHGLPDRHRYCGVCGAALAQADS